MKANDQRIARILKDAGVLDDGKVRAIDAWQQQWGGQVHLIAVDQGLADEKQVAAALARGLQLPRVDLTTTTVEPAALRMLDRGFCEEHAVIPVAVRDNGSTLWAAVSDPTDIDLLDQIRMRARVARVMPGVAGHREILDALSRHLVGGATGADGCYGIELSSGEEEEFKITNIAGSTLVKHTPGLERLRAELDAAPAVSDPSQIDPRSVFIGSLEQDAETAAGAVSPGPGWPIGPGPLTDGDRARIAAIANSLKQSDRALAAIIELCERKGLFGASELPDLS
ncbi:MAG: hypothetical protein JXR83_13965 [Deltaproteobacteria bacterium]|nr:hypothetical protein [Deltaproteobacteria bacterium]